MNYGCDLMKRCNVDLFLFCTRCLLTYLFIYSLLIICFEAKFTCLEFRFRFVHVGLGS